MFWDAILSYRDKLSNYCPVKALLSVQEIMQSQLSFKKWAYRRQSGNSKKTGKSGQRRDDGICIHKFLNTGGRVFTLIGVLPSYLYNLPLHPLMLELQPLDPNPPPPIFNVSIVLISLQPLMF